MKSSPKEKAPLELSPTPKPGFGTWLSENIRAGCGSYPQSAPWISEHSINPGKGGLDPGKEQGNAAGWEKRRGRGQHRKNGRSKIKMVKMALVEAGIATHSSPVLPLLLGDVEGESKPCKLTRKGWEWQKSPHFYRFLQKKPLPLVSGSLTLTVHKTSQRNFTPSSSFQEGRSRAQDLLPQRNPWDFSWHQD